MCVLCLYFYFILSVYGVQDSEAASCKMNSLGSNHSIPSTSVSTGSQSSSVNSMQEVLDDSCSDMTMMHPQDYSLESSPQTKKVRFKGQGWAARGRWSKGLGLGSGLLLLTFLSFSKCELKLETIKKQ